MNNDDRKNERGLFWANLSVLKPLGHCGLVLSARRGRVGAGGRGCEGLMIDSEFFTAGWG